MSDKWSEYNHQENEEMHIARNVKKNLVAERTANGFTVEVSVKLSYASVYVVKKKNVIRILWNNFWLVLQLFQKQL